MTGWHASDDLVTRYTDGSLPESDAWSLEKHLESCGGCALRVSHAVRGTAAGVVLAEIREAVLAETRDTVLATAPVPAAAPVPARSAVPRASASARPGGLLARAQSWACRWPAGGSGPVRVLWALGPAVRGAWLPAVLLVAVGAVALAYGSNVTDARPWLLALAPVVPVAGVALSYGPHADPMHEITAATPSAGLRLVLMRTAAVLAVSLPLLTLAGTVLPSSDAPNAAAWLLPGLALTLAALALAGFLGLRSATAVTGGAWLCAVLGPVLTAPGGRLTAQLSEQLSLYLDGARTQGGWAAAAALCAALLAARRPAFHFLEKS
ncbi:zf-HC2 domain-containing protein [Streptomyces sp. NPDC018972]|uniref:zf-HC2 domain-containing protein n=1 Tax=Streptomyces sp. NPDC018972 TaxID=3365060 RepID=UPI003788EF76